MLPNKEQKNFVKCSSRGLNFSMSERKLKQIFCSVKYYTKINLYQTLLEDNFLKPFIKNVLFSNFLKHFAEKNPRSIT